MRRIPMPSPNGTNYEGLFLAPRSAVAAYDGATNALMDKDDKPLADSGLAHRIMTACAGGLNMDDMGKLIETLVKAKMLTSAEAGMINSSLRDSASDDDDDPAMDRARRVGTTGLDSIDRRQYRKTADSAAEREFSKRFPSAIKLERM